MDPLGPRPELLPIGRVVALAPGVAGYCDCLGLDYACRGDETFARACERLSLPPGQALRGLLAACVPAPGRRWLDASMSELADHIEATHHALARRVFAGLAELMPGVIERHGASHRELRHVGHEVGELALDMEEHMVREERVLFPWLRRLERRSEIQGGPPWSVRRPISCMIHDHTGVTESLERIAGLTGDFTPPPDACDEYRDALRLLSELSGDTRAHIHKENYILFPAGIRAEAANRDRAASCTGGGG